MGRRARPWPRAGEDQAKYPLRPGTQVQAWIMMERPVPACLSEERNRHFISPDNLTSTAQETRQPRAMRAALLEAGPASAEASRRATSYAGALRAAKADLRAAIASGPELL